MSLAPARETDPRLAASIAGCARGEVPANIALMRLILDAPDPADLRLALSNARERLEAAGDPASADRLGQLKGLWDRHPRAWQLVKAVAADIDHGSPPGDPSEAGLHWARVFDRLARISPEASVALYSLGSGELLAAATAEIVERLSEWRLIGPDRDVLDMGCGIGRFVEALAPRVRSITGTDVSGEMIAAARRRCERLANVRLIQTTGRNLAALPTASFDLVLAVDVFPYLVLSGHAYLREHVCEIVRVLRPRGDLLVFNFSYRGDLARDREDLETLAATAGLVAHRGEPPAFMHWDGAAFRFRRS